MTLKELKAICDAVGDNPWHFDDAGCLIDDGFSVCWGYQDTTEGVHWTSDFPKEFIVTAKTELPRLIALLESAANLILDLELIVEVAGFKVNIKDHSRIKQLLSDISGES